MNICVYAYVYVGRGIGWYWYFVPEYNHLRHSVFSRLFTVNLKFYLTRHSRSHRFIKISTMLLVRMFDDYHLYFVQVSWSTHFLLISNNLSHNNLGRENLDEIGGVSGLLLECVRSLNADVRAVVINTICFCGGGSMIQGKVLNFLVSAVCLFLSLSLSVCLSLSLSLPLSLSVSLCLSLCLSLSVSLCVSLSLSLCLSVSLSLSLPFSLPLSLPH